MSQRGRVVSRRFPCPRRPSWWRAVDSLCGEGQVLVLGAFKEGSLWTALVLRRGRRGFDVIGGPQDLRRAMGLLSGDWRRDVRHLMSAVEDRYGPLALGCFGEAEITCHRPRGGANAHAGGWSRAGCRSRRDSFADAARRRDGARSGHSTVCLGRGSRASAAVGLRYRGARSATPSTRRPWLERPARNPSHASRGASESMAPPAPRARGGQRTAATGRATGSLRRRDDARQRFFWFSWVSQPWRRRGSLTHHRRGRSHREPALPTHRDTLDWCLMWSAPTGAGPHIVEV